MRRRRHKLQVSTFPFLAVLLCAMGALLLVLLVMDRRAHDAARARLEQATRHAAEEAARDAEARRAAREQEREAARAAREQRQQEAEAEHAHLESQIAEAQGQTQSVRAQFAQAADRLRAEQAEEAGLQQKIDAAHAQEETEQKAILQVRNEETKDAAASEASRKEREQMTAELAAMERALADLKTAREKQQKTYSVVPYNGKRGDSRRPLYIECAGDQLIFHPDRLSLPESRIATDAQQEVQARLARQKEQLPPDQAAAFAPYLMLLVRPDGVVSYYRLREALRGLKVDFGYEFIDADWALDFPADDGTARAQAWMAPAKPPAAASSATPPGKPPIGVKPDFGPIASAGTSAAGELGVAGPVEPAGTPGGLGRPTGGALETPGVGAPAEGADRPAAAGLSVGGAARVTPGASAEPGPADGQAGSQYGALTPDTAGPRGSSGSPGQGAAGRPSIAGSSAGGPASAGPPSVAGSSGSPPSGLTTEQALATAGSGSNGPANTSPPVPGPPPSAAAEPNGAATRAPQSTGSPNESQNGGSAAAVRGAGGPTDGLPPVASPATAAAAAKATPAPLHPAAADGTDDDPFLRAPPPPLLPNSSRPAPTMRPARLSGDRDWIIYVECKPEGVVIYPTQLLIPASALANPSVGNPLMQTIQQLISRKQATVRPGDAPYRPEVRFLVHPDAGRAYHLAYPLLDGLAAPKTAQPLTPDDDVSAIVTRH
ncbi:MAG TPA: hypothetical protein VMS17_28025 [Gemmataceae bacterium]|nr:hypothetical protein [Gemmataceae bacterium]